MKFEDLHRELKRMLVDRGSPEETADAVARVIAENSRDGVASHGVNRFRRLIRNIDQGLTRPDATPFKVSGIGGYEIWDGNLGFGIYNSILCTNRAVELAKTHGISCVSIRNSNHFLRGGTYGLIIAEAGMLGMVFTNTHVNMCAWGTNTRSVGNNPLVLAVPRANGAHVIADTSFSEYSYGKLQVARLEHRLMPSPAGFDENGNLSNDPGIVLKTCRLLPAAKWKGSSIALLLDLITSVSSFGNSSASIYKNAKVDEHSHSHTFIAINPLALGTEEEANRIIDESLEFLLSATPAPGETVRYPGQGMLKRRKINEEQGIPVDETVWNQILEEVQKSRPV
jgi:3-dehydro-L-gulonate 2-dehydrogenase